MALFGSGAGRLLNFAAQIALARWLGPARFGVYALGSTVFRIGTLLAPLGLHNGVLRFGSERLREGSDAVAATARRCVRLALASGVAAALLLAIAAPPLARLLSDDADLVPLLLALAVAVPAAAGLRVAAAATRISRRMQFSVVAEDVAQPAIFLVLVGVALTTGRDLTALGWAVAAAYGGALMVALAYLGRLFPSRRPAGAPSAAELLRFGWPTALAGAFGLLVLWLDRLFVGYYLDDSSVGLYQAASQASLALAVVLAAFNAIFTPMIGELVRAGERERLGDLYRANTRWGLLAALPLGAVFLVAPADALEALFGAAYRPAAPALVLLSLGQLVNLATGAVGFLLMMSGRERWWLGCAAIALAANVALNLTLIPRWGVAGAAAATALSVGGIFVAGLVLVRRGLALWPWDRRLAGTLATILIACGAAAGATRLAAPSASARSALALLAAGAATLVGWAWLERRGEAAEILARVRGR